MKYDYKVPKGKIFREIIYHAMFGTFFSDLSVLDKITEYVN